MAKLCTTAILAMIIQGRSLGEKACPPGCSRPLHGAQSYLAHMKFCTNVNARHERSSSVPAPHAVLLLQPAAARLLLIKVADDSSDPKVKLDSVIDAKNVGNKAVGTFKLSNPGTKPVTVS